MKRFSAPGSVCSNPPRPLDDDDAHLSDGSKKVKIVQSFESLFNSDSHSDITLNINHGQIIFHAHKMIVGLKSERLAALITSAVSESTDSISKPVLYLLEGPECCAVFSRFLYFIYSGAVWLHRDYVVPLLELSVKYGVGALATHCENYILQLLIKYLNADPNSTQPPLTLAISTVCDLYEAGGYREDTKKAAFYVLSRRFSELIRTERWIFCAWHTVLDLLSCDECVCEENLILVAATDWMKKNKLQDKFRIQEILASIRYPRLPRRVLYHLHATASFKNFPLVQDLIEFAIRYHCFKDVPEAQEEFVGPQYRTRGWSRNRHTVCGGERLCQSEITVNNAQINWDLDEHAECAANLAMYNGYTNGDHCDNNLYITHNNHHPACRVHVTRGVQRHALRKCGHHGENLNICSTCHPISSPITSVQPHVQCHPNSSRDTASRSSSPDISLQMDILSHI